MRQWIATMVLPLALLAMAGCSDDDNTVAPVDKVPTTPQGVYSVTGDGEVQVFWYGIYETDVKEYRVYRSYDATTGYTLIGSVDAVSNPNLNLLVYEYDDVTASNGTTYYYAVSAVDNANQESDLSAENVFDTPRPDGSGTMYPYQTAPTLAGFNLATGSVIAYDNAAADIYVDTVQYFDGDVTWVFTYLNVANANTDIQDMGYTSSFYDIGWAPTDGWSTLGYTEAILGHTYVIWTADNHFAKVRLTAISGSGVVSFDWAYQTSLTELGQLELAAPVRPEHGDDYPATKSAQILK